MIMPSAMPGAGPYLQAPYGQSHPRILSPVSSDPVRPATTAPEEAADVADRVVVILAVMLIGIVSCGGLVGTVGKAINEASTEASQSQQAENDRNAPREVTPGK